MDRSAARAWSGRVSNTSPAAPACTTITDDAVGDHVVQLAGDAGLLVARRRRRAASWIAARRLRAASASAHTLDGDDHREDRVVDLHGEEADRARPSRPASPTSDDPWRTSQGQRPQGDERGERDANLGNDEVVRHAGGEVTAVTSSGRRRRHDSAAPCTTARTTAATWAATLSSPRNWRAVKR